MTVAKRSKSEFDPRAFLAKADGGVTVSNYSKGQVVFTQGEPANAVFYIGVRGPPVWPPEAWDWFYFAAHYRP
jgi:hypothetical protein